MPHRLSKAEVRRCGWTSRATFWESLKDTYHESTEQREAMKYLRENCYYRIEYSVANSLAALMRK